MVEKIDTVEEAVGYIRSGNSTREELEEALAVIEDELESAPLNTELGGYAAMALMALKAMPSGSS